MKSATGYARGYLQGKVALVTGAAAKRSMGHGVAVRFGGEGAAAVIVDKVAVPRTRFSEDEGWEGLKSVATEVEGMGGKALAVVADISNPQEVDAAVAKALERFGKIYARSLRGDPRPHDNSPCEALRRGLENSFGRQSYRCVFNFYGGGQEHDRQGRGRQDRPYFFTSGE